MADLVILRHKGSPCDTNGCGGCIAMCFVIGRSSIGNETLQ
jgi:hypothetical protein